MPLHVAAREGHCDVCKLLLGRGAVADARTVHGDTPLSLCEDEPTRQLLLAAAASSEAHAAGGAPVPAPAAAAAAEPGPDTDALHFTGMTYDELSTATASFDRRPLPLGRLLGEGGDGEVYSARLRGRDVAVKRIKAETNGGRAAQAEVCVRYMRHANIVPIWGVLETTSFTCLVLPLMECSLYNALNSNTLLTAPKRLRIARDIAAGLAALHAARPEAIIHRDLKPANVLLKSCEQGSGWQACIADFGHARLLAVDEHSYASTATTGTVCFVCPEYYETGRARTASDLYSLGFILLLLLTGQRIDDLAVEINPSYDAKRRVWKMRRAALRPSVMALFALGVDAAPVVYAGAAAAGLTWTEAQATELWRLCIACLQPVASVRPTALDVHAALQALLPPDVPLAPMDFAPGIVEKLADDSAATAGFDTASVGTS